MIAPSMSRMAFPLVVLIAAGGLALVFAIKPFRHEPPVDTKTATASPALSKPASSERNEAPAALAAAQAEVKAVGTTLAGSPAVPGGDDGMPAFDIARIEPTGEAVIAGHAAPRATVELLRNGELLDSAIADQSGQFAMVPPRLPPGTYDLTLRSKQPDGKQALSKQSVAVELESGPNAPPIVALMAPDKPTVVLSQPATPKPMTGTVVVDTVEIEPGGKFHVTGRANPGATVRLYLNESLVAPVTAGADGRFAVTINKGVSPGSYRVRVDEVEATSGAVRTRAEVPFNVPDTVVTALTPVPAASSTQPDVAASQMPQSATATSAAPSDGSSPSTVVVPKITTTTVSRGDSLWRISRLTYGAGQRYAAIYRANRKQIRNPDLIYPGQIFVLPTR